MWPRQLFTDEGARQLAEEQGLESVENEDLTLTGLKMKLQVLEEAGVEADDPWLHEEMQRAIAERMKENKTMSSRDEILEEFKVDQRGIIKSPGKFEGEMLYAPHFYESVLEGGGDDTIDTPEGPVDIFIVRDVDREEFPELDEDDYAIALWEDDQGFVHLEHFASKDALEEYSERLESAAAEFYEEHGEE